MKTRSLIIQVSPEEAQAYEAASPETQREIDAALRRRLRGILRTATPDPGAGWQAGELESLLKVEPKTGAEIVAEGLTGGWADQAISDGLTWVEEQRKKRRERLQW